LDFCVQCGICKKSGNYFMPGETMIYVPNSSPFVSKHHTNWRMKAMQRMDTRDERDLFFSFPMSIGRKDFEILREKLAHLVREATQLCRDSDPEEIACLNIDLFELKP
jgi:hypothetical protein